jgi:hypothetical protein
VGPRHRIAHAAALALALAPAWTVQALAAGATAPRTYALPAGTLRLSDTRLLASAGERVTFTVRLTRRAVGGGRLQLTLPRQWTGRSGVSRLPYASVPANGRGSSSRVRVRRRGRVVTFAFKAARKGDLGRFAVTDRGLPARAYSLAYTWREDGAPRRRGTATVTVYAARRAPR